MAVLGYTFFCQGFARISVNLFSLLPARDQLNTLRREKQKLVEKIMDQYRVLEPGVLPRTK